MSISIGKMALFVSFCLVLTSVGFSITAKDIFVSLDKNEATLTGGFAEFTLKSPVTATVDATKLNYFIQANNTPTASLKILIQKNVSYQVPVYSVTVVNKTCALPNGTANCPYNQVTQTGTKTAYSLVWSTLGSESFTLNQLYKFRVEATWKPKLVKGVWTASRDWIPFINVAGTDYPMTAWAWWNVTRRNMVEVNFTTGFSNYTNVELWTILNSTVLGASPVTDTVYANDTQVTWLNTTSGLEQSIPYWFENYTDGGNSWLWINLPVYNTAINNTVRIYYNSTDVKRLSTYDPRLVFRRYNNFENYTNGQAISSDFGAEDGNLLLATSSEAFRGSISVVATPNFVYGFGTREYKSGIMEMWFKAGGFPADASFYLYNGINGTLGSQLANVGSITYPTAWTKVSLVYNSTKANVTIGATTYTSFSAYTENISQFMFPYYPLAKYVDEVRLRQYVPDEQITRAFSSVQNAPVGSSLTITQNYPNNAVTNYTNDIYFGYNVSMDGQPANNCSLYINGVLTKTNATALVNLSDNNIYYEFAENGSYAWSIGCYNGSTTISTGNRTLSLIEYFLNGSASAYELTRQPFNITFTFSNFTYSGVTLVYNGTHYPASDLGGNVWNASSLVPIVQTNNSALSYYWNFTRANSSFSGARLTSTASQNVYFSYVPDGSEAKFYNLLEGFSETIYLYVLNLSSVGTETVTITIDGINRTATYVGYNGSVLNYSYTFNVGTIPVLNLSKNWTWYSRISYLGTSRNETLTTVNVTIFKVTATDCSYGIPVFVYITYNEENGTYVNDSDYSVRVVTKSRNITNTWSRSVTQQANLTICLYPTWSNATSDLSLIYGHGNNTYSQRTFYNFNMLLNNVTKEQPIYLLNLSKSYLVNIESRDQYGSVAPNVLVFFERFNYTSNQFLNATVVYTTEGGTGLTYLVRYDVPYRITLRGVTGGVLSTYENYFISASPITLRTVSAIVDVYQRFLDVVHSCSYDTTSKILFCSYDDPNSILTRVEFKVTEVFNYVSTVVCAENNTAFSGEFTCDLSATDNASKGYYYEINAYDPTDVEYFYVLEKGSINKPASSIFGANGVLFALFLFISMFFIGIWKPVVAVTLGIASIFVSYLVGWLNFGTAPVFIFGTIIALGLFVVWKLKER